METRTNTGYVAFLSVVAAIGGILFGYDTAVIFGYDHQRRDAVRAQRHAGGLVRRLRALIGSIGGVAVAGILSDRFGRKLTMLLAAVLFTASGIGCAVCGDFSASWSSTASSEDIGIGVVSIVSPMYISEVAVAETVARRARLALPTGHHHRLPGGLPREFPRFSRAAETAIYDSPWMQQIMVTEMWRGMLGSNALPAVLFFVVIFFSPESPRWLILRNRAEGAHAVLQRIYRSSEAADGEIASIRSAEAAAPKSEWRALTSPGMRKALLIGVAIAMLGQFMGVNAVLYYGPTIFEDAGLSSGNIALLAGVSWAWWSVSDHPLWRASSSTAWAANDWYYWGVSGMILSLLCIGVYFLAGAAWGLSPPPAGLLPGLRLLLRRVDQRRDLRAAPPRCTPRASADWPCRSPGSRSGFGHLPDRPADPLDARDADPRRHFPPLRRHVRPLHAHHVARRARHRGSVRSRRSNATGSRANEKRR